MPKKYYVGSLFAGVGGICLGFKNATSSSQSKYELIWANEYDEHACVTYEKNFRHSLIKGDITKILHPENADEVDGIDSKHYEEKQKEILEKRIDVLTAGFPCQAFSIAGERKGFEDERGNLFWAIIHLVRFLDEKHGKPRVLFLENVRNLIGHDKGRTYKMIKSQIEHLGYTVIQDVINTMDCSDLPQNRARIYIICFLEKKDADAFKAFDVKKHIVKRTKFERETEIRSIIDYEGDVDDRYYYTKKKYPHYFLTQSEYDYIPIDVRNEHRVNLEEQVNEMYQFYQVRRGMYVRKNKSNVCPTLTANMGTGGHNVPLILDQKGVRKITPKEAFRLQGFPIGKDYNLPDLVKGKRFPDSYLYKQAGNAVSVPVITMLATALLNVFIGNDVEEDVSVPAKEYPLKQIGIEESRIENTEL